MDTKKLRQKILDLAIHGKLVPQDPNDEPASVLLERIRKEKEQLIKEGKIKAPKKSKSAGDTSHYPKEGLFAVPKGWAWTSLGDIAVDMADGPFGSNLKREHYTQNREVRIIQLSNIGEKGWREENTKYTTFTHARVIERSIVNPGDLVIAKMMPAGRAIICPDSERAYVLSSDAVKYVPSKEIFNRYLLYAINSSVVLNQIHAEVQGVTRARTSIEKLRGYLIPIPPKKEQYRIVQSIEYWLRLHNIIEHDKGVINGYIERVKSRILELAIRGKLVPQDPSDEPAIELLKRINPSFTPSHNLHYDEALPSGWAITPLYIICDTINGLWKGKKEPLINVGVIRNANFTKDFTLDYSKIEYIDVEQKSFEKRNLENGDIIVEKSGGSDNFPVGRSILYRGENGKYSFSNFTMSLRIAKKDCILPEYLYYVLQYRYRRGDMKQLQTQTTGLHNLLTDKFMSLTIPIPPVEEQLRIVQTIKNLFGIVNGIRDLVNDNKQGINSL